MNPKFSKSKLFSIAEGKIIQLKIFYSLLFVLAAILVLAAHFSKLDSIPPGLFFDESSIGYNASIISQTRFDEYEGQIPIYFKSVADYDSPILIYSTALIFSILGTSEYTLRLATALFFTAALFLTIILATDMFKKNWAVWIYLLISFGFLPQFFTISRLSFEVISQLTWVAATCLSIKCTFHQDTLNNHRYIKALICGFILGTSTFTYSTASLLSPLMLVSVWAIYLRKDNIKKLIYISSAFLISLIPYAIFTFTSPGALTSRFHEISYIYDPISLAEKAGIFISNYLAYWTPSFLLIHGDANLRHSTGHGGVVYLAVLIMFIASLAGFYYKRNFDKFKIFLLINLLISPIAAALTSEGVPHSLRGLMFGYYIILLSCYGLKYLLEINNSWVRISSIMCISILLIYEVIGYQVDYFIHYPARVVDAMGSYDFRGSLEFAIDHNPRKIILFNNFAGGFENLQFYEQVVDNQNNIPIQADMTVTPEPGICVIYRRVTSAEEELDKFSIAYKKFESRKRPSAMEKEFGAKPFSGVLRARCYE